MAISVREHAPVCQATCLSNEFHLSALPQLSDASRALSSQAATVIVFVGLALVVAVVLTAIWADKDRRKAALDVLDRLLRWHK